MMAISKENKEFAKWWEQWEFQLRRSRIAVPQPSTTRGCKLGKQESPGAQGELYFSVCAEAVALGEHPRRIR
jgi:predicted double-glycine peptidase